MGVHQVEDGGSCVVEIVTSLAGQLREELQVAAADSSTVQPTTSSCSASIVIAEVGSLTRNVDPAEYDPHHVAIGPYHRIRNPQLARDDEKIRCLDAVLSAANGCTTLEVYLQELARLEDRVRSCYAHLFRQLDSSAFVRMLLLDGCYLLVRFGGVVDGARRANGESADKCTAAPAAGGGGGDKLEAVAVVRDVFYLAENQIPFFVLDTIHRLTYPDDSTTVSAAADSIARYVRELLRCQQYSVATPPLAHRPPPGNLLHLLHAHLQPTVTSCPAAGCQQFARVVGRWRTATEYHAAGVKFKSRPLGRKGVRCVLDVKLDGGRGVLHVPRLSIDAETWRLLRNLMALEQHNPDGAGSHVTAYCVFVSQLACTARDVELLSRRAVIVHGLGNHGEVASLFSDLCKGIVFGVDDPGCNYLRPICQALDMGFRCRPRRWMVWLRQRYFSNPWLAVGLVAAAIGLLCSLVQAVYAVLSYRQVAG